MKRSYLFKFMLIAFPWMAVISTLLTVAQQTRAARGSKKSVAAAAAGVPRPIDGGTTAPRISAAAPPPPPRINTPSRAAGTGLPNPINSPGSGSGFNDTPGGLGQVGGLGQGDAQLMRSLLKLISTSNSGGS
jgi:hypothetical protein